MLDNVKFQYYIAYNLTLRQTQTGEIKHDKNNFEKQD